LGVSWAVPVSRPTTGPLVVGWVSVGCLWCPLGGVCWVFSWISIGLQLNSNLRYFTLFLRNSYGVCTAYVRGTYEIRRTSAVHPRSRMYGTAPSDNCDAVRVSGNVNLFDDRQNFAAGVARYRAAPPRRRSPVVSRGRAPTQPHPSPTSEGKCASVRPVLTYACQPVRRLVTFRRFPRQVLNRTAAGWKRPGHPTSRASRGKTHSRPTTSDDGRRKLDAW